MKGVDKQKADNLRRQRLTRALLSGLTDEDGVGRDSALAILEEAVYQMEMWDCDAMDTIGADPVYSEFFKEKE